MCFCDEGFHGPERNLGEEEWARRVSIRKHMAEVLTIQFSTWTDSLFLDDGVVQWWMNSLLSYAASVSDRPAEIDLDYY